MFYSPDIAFDVCRVQGSDSQILRNQGAYIESANYLGVQDCGGGRADAILSRATRTYFGACIFPQGGRKGSSVYNGYMYLTGVNDTYTSPQIIILDTNVPIATSETNEACTSPADCQAKSGLYYESFDSTCTQTTQYQAETGMIPYTCYRTSNSYVMIGCQGPNTYDKTYYNDSSCTTPSQSHIVGDKCGTAGSFFSTHCTAVRSPPSTSPSSSSPSASPSASSPSASPLASPSASTSPSTSPSSASPAPSSSASANQLMAIVYIAAPILLTIFV